MKGKNPYFWKVPGSILLGLPSQLLRYSNASAVETREPGKYFSRGQPDESVHAKKL